MAASVDGGALLTQAGAALRRSDRQGVWRFSFRERRGWLWVEDRDGEPVAHLSLLVADGHTETREVAGAFEWLPRPATSDLEHFREGDDEFIRAVARFPLGDGHQSLARSLLHLQWTAELVQRYEVPAQPVEGVDALQDLRAVLGEAGVAAPPVPASCRSTLRTLGPWWWGSTLFHPFWLYMFGAVDALIDHWDRTPHFAMSHAGHGVNSYGLNVIAAAGPVAAYVQHGFGGAYSDPVRDREQIAATYERLHHVLAAADRDDSPARWLLLFSNFRDVCQLVDLHRPVTRTDENFDFQATDFADERTLWRALADRLPYDFDAGVPIDW